MSTSPDPTTPVDDLDVVLSEQIDYYRARAEEYDDWFLRRGRFDRGEAATRAWFTELDQVRDALSGVDLDGARVLELAPGTGLWTQRIAERAGSVVALDASPEMIEQCRARLGALASRVEFRVTDLFAWEPRERFGAVVFCFWISHVPDERLDSFLRAVRTSLDDGGSVFFLDGRAEPSSTARDHVLPAPGEQRMTRRLDDGRTFEIVKRFRAAGDLVDRCAAAGLDVAVHETATYFQYGVGRAAN